MYQVAPKSLRSRRGWVYLLLSITEREVGMRVQRVLMPGGFVDTRMGTPNVRPGVHFIRPDGNSDQFRKGVLQ